MAFCDYLASPRGTQDELLWDWELTGNVSISKNQNLCFCSGGEKMLAENGKHH